MCTLNAVRAQANPLRTRRCTRRPLCICKASGRTLRPACAKRFQENETFSRRAVLLGVGLLLQAGIHANAPPSQAEIQTMDDLKDKIKYDFVQGQYYVTGNLSSDLYEDDCTFIDPTVEVTGVKKYVDALKVLFDHERSKAELISIKVDSPTTIKLMWRLEGYLRIGGLKFKPYTGTTTYYINDKRKVRRHEETWDISAVDAFVSTFIPSFGAPPAPPIVGNV